MKISHKHTHKLWTRLLGALLALSAGCGAALAQQGSTLPPTYGMNGQKPGSVLFYTMYTSNIIWPHQENTRINMTNTHTTQTAYVHLFFVDSASCQSADSFVCLTANQTFTFVASDYDPGITGYLLAVTVDKTTGMPIQFNHLIGDYYLKLLSGHNANLGAEAFAALKDPPAALNVDGSTVDLKFDDVNYNAGPRMLGLSSVPSRLDGNDTLLILARLGGDLAGGESGYIGGLLGLTYDDAEKGYSFTMAGGKCLFRGSLTDSNPRMVPRFSTIVRAGRVGWMKIWATANVPVLGVMINLNQSANNTVTAFSGGHALHTLSTTNTGSITIPVFIPSC
jgi:hypothetical protein